MRLILITILLFPLFLIAQKETPPKNSLSFEAGTGIIFYHDRPGFSIQGKYSRKINDHFFFEVGIFVFRSALQDYLLRTYPPTFIELNGEEPNFTFIDKNKYFSMISDSEYEVYLDDTGGARILEPSGYKYFRVQFNAGFGIDLLRKTNKRDLRVAAGLLLGHTDTQFTAQLWPGEFSTFGVGIPQDIVLYVPTLIRYNHWGWYSSLEYLRYFENNSFWGAGIRFTQSLPATTWIIGLPELKFGVRF